MPAFGKPAPPKEIIAIDEVVGGRYRVIQRIGRGGVGAVYQARDEESGRGAAIKVLGTRFSEEDVAFQRFQREAAVLLELQHPNIVSMWAHGRTDRGVAYIVLELLAGRSLKEELADVGAFDVHRCARIARDVLNALETAHGHNFVHRDIKPANIHLCEDGSAKLIDFGMARLVQLPRRDRLTRRGMTVGTPRYMAPEQIRGAKLGQTVDLYPVGLVMAEMLLGRPLARGDTHMQILEKHVGPSPWHLPIDVRETPLAPVIARALGKDVVDRYPSAAAMRDALDAAMAEVPSSG